MNESILNDLSKRKIVKLNEEVFELMKDSTKVEEGQFYAGVMVGISKTLQYLGLHIENITN